ncbi:MAG: YadA C-terminal domain-containing protein [Scandinavium sp.]|uniref:YadA C-terminal domain-containing protein n=1 Tax=Scandinavium sp. TaxID=2830653 RepID=UPI003F3828E2
MKMKLIALAIMAGAVSGMAQAQLSLSTATEIENFHQAHPDVPDGYIKEMGSISDIQRLHNFMTFAADKFDHDASVPPVQTGPDDAASHQQNPVDYRRDVTTAANVTAERQLRESTSAAYNKDASQYRFAVNNEAARKVQKDVTAQNNAIQNMVKTEGEAAAYNKDASQYRFAVNDEAARKVQKDVTAQNNAIQNMVKNEGEAAAYNKDASQYRFAVNDEAARKVQKDVTAQNNAIQNMVKTEGEAAAYNKDASQYRFAVNDEAARKVQKDTNAKNNAVQQQLNDEAAAHDKDARQYRFDVNNAAAAKKASDSTTAIAENKQHIEQLEHNLDIRTDRQNEIDQAIGKEFTQTRQLDDQQSTDINTLTAGVQQNKNTGAYAQSRADAAYANTQANQQALKATNHRVAENSQELANHEQRIQTLEANNSASFGKLKNEVDDNRQRASAAISGVAAMANIPQVIQGQTFSVGAGVGTTDSESALAVGFSARATEHVVVKASVSDDTQQNFVVGGGVSYGW